MVLAGSTVKVTTKVEAIAEMLAAIHRIAEEETKVKQAATGVVKEVALPVVIITGLVKGVALAAAERAPIPASPRSIGML
jgi:hypothetical protein